MVCGNRQRDVVRHRAGVISRPALAICVAFGMLGGGGVKAEDLSAALASAYRANPGLEAERARLRASDEEVPRAKSGYRPRVTGNADAGVRHSNTNPPLRSDGKTRPRGFDVQVTQPVFRGFRTVNAVREAEANVRAARASLRSIEQTTLLEGVTAYVDVIRDQAIVRLRQNNVRVLSKELRATKDRFNVGEVTRTDVAQARARRAGAVSQLDLAKANLRSSRAEYERVIGHPPSGLIEPQPLDARLPRSLSEALEIAQAENPNVISAAFLEQAARHAVDRIHGEFLPEVNLEAEYQRRYNSSRVVRDTESASITGRVTVPLYQAGDVSARVRQAKQTAEGRLRDIEQARVRARADVVSAWSRLISARAKLVSDRIQVSANQTALTGVRKEEEVGQRTLLDVLDAEQELLDAQVQLAITRRDLVVASYSVLSAVGRLTAADLSLPVAIYDNESYYRLVREKWWGVTVTRDAGYVAETNGTAD